MKTGRSYWAFSVFGSPEKLVARISTYVESHDLGAKITGVRYEKRKSKSSGEFYLFLAIAPDELNKIPEEIDDALSQIGMKPRFDQFFSDDEIKTMTWGEQELAEEKFSSFIEYTPPQPIRYDNPFDLVAAAEPDEDARSAYNNLLSWLSATGEGSWNTFRQVCAELGLNATGEIRHIFRRLRLLGHVEYLDEGQHWVVAPPCFVELATETEEYTCFLAGGRTQRLLSYFENAVEASQSPYGAPDTIRLTFASRSEAEAIVARAQEYIGPIHVVGQTALHLASVLPNLDGWRRMLRPLPVTELRYKIMQWDGQGFSRWVSTPDTSGMYELRESNQEESVSPSYLFFDAVDHTWRQGDWYGLRYLANVCLQRPGKLIYDSTHQCLYVPDTHRLPDLYERALVLASGELPHTSAAGVVFSAIPPMLAETLASKLEAVLERNY